jgi:hypothetical protein
VAEVELLDRPVTVHFRVSCDGAPPSALSLNGHELAPTAREPNAYRVGGWRIPAAELSPLLRSGGNELVISC